MNKVIFLTSMIFAVVLVRSNIYADNLLSNATWNKDLIKPGEQVIASVRASTAITHVTIKIWEKSLDGNSDKLVHSATINNDNGFIQLSWIYNCPANPVEQPTQVPRFYFTAEAENPNLRVRSNELIVRETYSFTNIDGAGRAIDEGIFFVLKGKCPQGNIVHRVPGVSVGEGRVDFDMLIPCMDYTIHFAFSENEFNELIDGTEKPDSKPSIKLNYPEYFGYFIGMNFFNYSTKIDSTIYEYDANSDFTIGLRYLSSSISYFTYGLEAFYVSSIYEKYDLYNSVIFTNALVIFRLPVGAYFQNMSDTTNIYIGSSLGFWFSKNRYIDTKEYKRQSDAFGLNLHGLCGFHFGKFKNASFFIEYKYLPEFSNIDVYRKKGDYKYNNYSGSSIILGSYFAL